MGVQSMNDFRRKRPYQYLEMITRRQRDLEKRARPSRIRPTLLDRSLYDYLAYLRVAGIRPPESFLAMLTQSFDRVFLLDTLSGFSHRLETGRTLNRDFSLNWRDACREVYMEYGMETIPVKVMPVTERMKLIKERLMTQEPG
jgi:predicted ATPase